MTPTEVWLFGTITVAPIFALGFVWATFVFAPWS